MREPENEADRNAILVYDKAGALGYLHRSIARWLARPIERMNVPVIVEGRIWRGTAAYVGLDWSTLGHDGFSVWFYFDIRSS
ncbi:HIRAN domain-containing protein [Microbacterium sp.]|uniref:HIRAN domain-containing protein n=1 Tax=Microbacterium sp. TaxID=51671 RepID=UPI00262C2A62|nr:HIRAN domain-containing protein [Microbacterium sp.]